MPSGSRREGGGPQRDEAGQAGHQGSELVNAKPWQMRYESGYSRRDCRVRAVPLTGADRTRGQAYSAHFLLGHAADGPGSSNSEVVSDGNLQLAWWIHGV